MWKNCDDMLSRFHLIPERNGHTDGRTNRRTDGRTDRFAISISRVSMLTRDKNRYIRPMFRFISEMIQDRAIFYCRMRIGNRAQNGTTFNDLERSLSNISRSRHYLTLNISEPTRDTDIVTME